MCLHTHTIVHQHLYNIKGVIYKSTGIIHSAGPAGARLQDFPTRVEPVWGRGTGGVSIFVPVVWEDPLGPVLVGIRSPEPQVRLVSQSHRQASVTVSFKFSVHISVGKAELGTAS